MTNFKRTEINLIPEDWRVVKLGEVCKINPPRPKNFNRSPDAPTTFIPMAAVDEKTGTIAKPEVVPYSRVSKGYTCFEEGNVLFAKITPCMQNGKHVIARNLIDGIGFGTTEFHVLRPNNEVLPDWIHFFLRQPYFLQEAMAYFTGAVGQQRVPDSFLSNYMIPLPPIEEQKRIAATLQELMQEVERARTACEKQLEAAKALPTAYLRQVFESEEARKWERKRLGEHVTKVGSGITPLGGHRTYLPSGVPFIRSQNVHMNRFEHHGLVFISKEQDEAMQETRVFPGDVLLNITGASIGRVCVVPTELCPANVNQHVSIIRGHSSFEPAFLSFFISTPEFQRFVMSTQAGATRQALTKTLIENFEIPCPPLVEQKRISVELKEKMAHIENLQSAIRNQQSALNALPQAILRKAFRGEL